jgi:CubicO group peptidase (beta-lactamase class C family)
MVRAMKKLLIFLLLPFQLMSQSLSDTLQDKIDSLFKRFNSHTPGCAVAITKNGELVYKKGFGMANLEYDIPNMPSTIFHIASESKQYVAFCMLLLEKEGKLSLDDDIRKYLDFVPDFGKRITIKHLVYHTSGLRDQWQLLANAGWQLDDVITQDHVIKLVRMQKALNFEPGEEHLYCNTGYTLMAEIVKKASGLSLRDYADKNIFKPLGMENTHFHDDYQEIVKNRAYSYDSKGPGRYEHRVLSYSTVGATSLFTTVEDEAKWLMNFENGKVGGMDLVNHMHETGVLNSGKKLKYAFGLSIDEHKGWKAVGHGGGDAGYRTYALRFPEQRLGIIIFSNFGSYNPYGAAEGIADILLSSKEVKRQDSMPAADSLKLKLMAGRYYTETGRQLYLVWHQGKIWSRSPNQTSGGNAWNLSDAGDGNYKTETGESIRIKNSGNADSVKQLVVEHPGGFNIYYRKPPKPVYTVEQLNKFAGKYYSPETEATYIIIVKNQKLYMQHRKYNEVVLEPFVPDQFSCSYWWMSNINFARNNKGAVTSFEVNSGRILHLKYQKL